MKLLDARWWRPMSCWVRVRKGGPWHQAEYDSRAGREHAKLCCSGQVVKPHPDEIMDYRWRPALVGGRACMQPACQREVDP